MMLWLTTRIEETAPRGVAWWLGSVNQICGPQFEPGRVLGEEFGYPY